MYSPVYGTVWSTLEKLIHLTLCEVNTVIPTLQIKKLKHCKEAEKLNDLTK